MTSVLKFLEDQRIFSVDAKRHFVLFTEECDRYFKIQLTPDEVRQLAGELIAMAIEIEAAGVEKDSGTEAGS